MDIKEFRQQYPQYNDIPDMELAKKLHAKSYSDMPFDAFATKFGVSAAPAKSTYLGDVLRERGQALFATGGVGQSAPQAAPEGGRVPLLQQFARGSVEALPVAGAMFGGAIGAAPGLLTGPAAIPVMSAGGVAGAGLGAGGGESIKQAIQQAYPDYFGVKPQSIPGQYADVAKSGLAGATGEAGGQLLTAGVGKLLAPGAKKMTEEGKALYETAKKQNLPLSPDVFTKSKFTKSVVRMADEIPPGNWAMAKKRTELATKLTQARNQFVTDTLELPAPSEFAGLKAKSKSLYAEAVKQAGGDEAAHIMPELEKFIKSGKVDGLVGSEQLRDTLTAIKKEMAGSDTKTMPFNRAMDLYAKAWRNFSKLSPDEVKLRGELVSALDADIQGIDKQLNAVVYDTIKLAKGASKAAQSTRDAALVESMLRKATDYDNGKEMFIFKPLKFKAEVDRLMPVLQRIFAKDPAKLELINRFASEMSTATTDMGRLAGFKPPGMLEKGAGVAALAYQPYLAVPAGFDVWMSHSLMNPKGWMKQWLTVGAQPRVGTKLAKEGVKAISLKTFNRKKDEREQE